MTYNFPHVQILILLFLTGAFGRAVAQNHLSGIVLDAKDSTALANVSVYFDGTTIGTITKSDGSFALKDNYETRASVVISFLGYGTLVVPAEQLRGRLAKVYLQQSTEALNEVFLDDDPWSREKKLAEFKREFLGSSEEAEQCEIKNEEAIRLRYSPSDKKLYADCLEPIIIVNRYLGYKVYYELGNFHVKYNLSPSGFTIPQRIYYEGISRFEELRKKVPKRYLRHRERAYLGSVIHFNRSLATEALVENDFKIFRKRREVPPYSLFEIEREEGGVNVTAKEKQFTVLYDRNYQSSYLVYAPFLIDGFGNHYPPTAVTVGGAMGMRRIAALLPLDYGLEPASK